MNDRLPDVALSVRQPWAWAIMFAGKDIENRSWQSVRTGRLDRTGRVAIHAAKGVTQRDYADARGFMAGFDVECVPAADMWRGAIIGSVEFCGVVQRSDSPWWMGPRGIVLRDPRPCKPIPCKGNLGIFNWRDPSNAAEAAEAPLQWMTGVKKKPTLPAMPLFEGMD